MKTNKRVKDVESSLEKLECPPVKDVAAGQAYKEEVSKKAKERHVDPIWVKGSFEVVNSKGLHARPCAEIARCAAKFRSQIHIIYEKKKVEAKSLLGLLTLAAGRGSQISVQAKGVDAEAAVEAIVELSRKQFGIEY